MKFVMLLGLAACLSSGCVGLNSQVIHGPGVNMEQPSQVGVRWEPQVAYAPDPMHGGQTMPGLVARVYLFNGKMLPVEGDGALHVELTDTTVNPPKSLEQWNFPAASLAKFQRRDAIGPGYSLFLPWSTYSPEVTKVVMKVGYQPKNGMPMYASPSTVLLENGKEFPTAAR